MTITVDSDSEVTRLTTVNPTTGVEIPFFPLQEDATMVRPIRKANGPKKRITEEFLPSRNMCSTAEVTRPWQRNAGWRETIGQLFAKVSKGSFIVVFAAIASISVMVTLLFPVPPETKIAPKMVTTTKENSTLVATVEATTPSTHEVSLARAVQLLCDGHIEEAKKVYQELTLLFPGDDSFPLAITILTTLEEQR